MRGLGKRFAVYFAEFTLSIRNDFRNTDDTNSSGIKYSTESCGVDIAAGHDADNFSATGFSR